MGTTATASRGIEDVAEQSRRSDGPDLIIQGSSTIYPALLAAGLIDELTLMTFPVMLGERQAAVRRRDAAPRR